MVHTIQQAAVFRLWFKPFATGLALLLAAACQAASAASEPTVSFRHIGTMDGLENRWIYDITQDPRGMIWLASEGGLFRYDGERFRHYLSNPADPTSLPANTINRTYVAPNGALWIGTRSGLARYDENHDRFINYRHSDSNANTLSGNSITALQADADGSLWVGTWNGLNHIDTVSGHITRYLHADYEGLPSNKIRCLFSDAGGRLWIGTEQGLAWKIPGQARFHVQALQLHGHTLIQQVKTIHAAEHARIWIGGTGGLILLDTAGDNRIVQSYGHSGPPGKALSSKNVRDLLYDDRGHLWLATDQGLNRIDTASGQVEWIKRHQDRPSGLGHNNTTTLFKDRSGLLWIGSLGGGIDLWNPLGDLFQTVSVRSGQLSNNVVWGIVEDPDDSLWVSSEGGLAHIAKDGTSTHYRHDVDDPHSLSSDLAGALVFSAAHQLWIGTAEGLNLLDTRSGVLRQFHHDPDNSNSLSDDFIFSLNHDPGGGLWVATGVGLDYLPPDGKPVRHYKHQAGRPHSLSSDNVHVLYRDPGGDLWIGTGNGLNRYNATRENFDRYQYDPDPSHASEDAYIVSIYGDGKRILWLGHSEQGLLKLDFRQHPEHPSVQRFTTEHGLPNRNVAAIMGDGLGHLWISTQQGLARFDPRNGAIRSFSVRSGLPDDEFNEDVVARARNGDLLFGTTRGFTRFSPQRIAHLQPGPPPKVLITGISVLGQPLHLGKPPWLLPELRLDYDQGMLTLYFAMASFVDPAMHRFQYRLNNLDPVWVEAGSTGFARYSALPPGGYEFQLRGRDATGRSSAEITRLPLLVGPPPWQSSTAWLLYALTTVALIATALVLTQRRRRFRRQTHQALAQSESRLQLALWASGYGSWDWHHDGDRMFRQPFWELIGESARTGSHRLAEERARIHADDIAAVETAWNTHLAGDSDAYEANYRIETAAGNWIWIHERGRAVETDRRGKALRISGTHKDVSDEVRARHSARLFGAAFEHTNEGVLILDAKRNIVAVNRAFTVITGYQRDEIIGKHSSVLSSEQTTHRMYERIWGTLHSSGHWQGEVWEQRKNGEVFPEQVDVSSIRNDAGAITHYVVVFSDITERKRAEEELRRLANYDVLTSLPNRMLFRERLSHALAHARRRERQLALLFMDLDRFKQINDSLGHNIGDKLLQTVALRLTQALRADDTVARLSGDEFVILLEAAHDVGHVAEIAEKVLHVMDPPFQLNRHEVSISISIGIAIFPNDGEDAPALLKAADTAMYHAKHGGRNNFKFYAEHMNSAALERLTLENDLRRALRRDEFLLHFQPRVVASSGKICGAEVLLRWNHPGRGMVPPGDFIALAEETGLILPIGAWVFRTACTFLQLWQPHLPAGFVLSVNLAPKQLEQFTVLEMIHSALRDTGAQASQLELEITETTLMSNIQQAHAHLRTLNELGFRVAIDDFGTGHSSLKYLKDLPIQTLKIDRAFTALVGHERHTQAIVRTIVQLAQSLELNVVAEGVETVEQLQFMAGEGCHEIQGFLLAKPLPVKEFEALLKLGTVDMPLAPCDTNREISSA